MGRRLSLSFTILQWCQPCQPLEELRKEGGIGEIVVIRDPCDGLFRIFQFYFDLCEQGIVYPLLGRLAADSMDDAAEMNIL